MQHNAGARASYTELAAAARLRPALQCQDANSISYKVTGLSRAGIQQSTAAPLQTSGPGAAQASTRMPCECHYTCLSLVHDTLTMTERSGLAEVVRLTARVVKRCSSEGSCVTGKREQGKRLLQGSKAKEGLLFTYIQTKGPCGVVGNGRGE